MSEAFRVMTFSGALLAGVGFGWTVHPASKRDVPLPPSPAAVSVEESNPDPIIPRRRVRAATPESFFDRLHEALGRSDRGKRQRLIAGLTDDLDARQIREALESVSQSRIPNRDEVMAQLFARWGELEPLAALEFAKSLARISDQREAISAIVNGWMEQNPVAAEKWAGEQTDRGLGRAAWEAIILAYAADDPGHALALAQKTKLSWRGTNNAAGAIFGRWAARDPAGAAAQTTELPQGLLRMEAQCIVATQWAETDPFRAVEWAESLPDLLPNENDGFGVTTTSVGADRTNTVMRIVDTWIKRNADDAANWLSQLPDDTWRANLLRGAISSNLESAHDPGIALQLANLLPEGMQRHYALEYSAERLGQFHPENALALLSGEIDEPSRKPIIDGLVGTLKGDNLLAALHQMKMGELPRGNYTKWADPETAMGWVAKQPDHGEYLARIAAAWMAKEPSRAEEIVRMVSPDLKDHVLSGAVESSFHGPPYLPAERTEKLERAGQWIPEISDPALRQAAYRNLAKEWLQVDSESARRWIEGIPISNQMKKELLQPPEREMELD